MISRRNLLKGALGAAGLVAASSIPIPASAFDPERAAWELNPTRSFLLDHTHLKPRATHKPLLGLITDAWYDTTGLEGDDVIINLYKHPLRANVSLLFSGEMYEGAPGNRTLTMIEKDDKIFINDRLVATSPSGPIRHLMNTFHFEDVPLAMEHPIQAYPSLVGRIVVFDPETGGVRLFRSNVDHDERLAPLIEKRAMEYREALDRDRKWW